MAGNKIGGMKARDTNLRLYGADFYSIIGAKGGSKGRKDGTIKGFAMMPKYKVSEAGRKGGTISRRTK